jgi:hypothetical protein
VKNNVICLVSFLEHQLSCKRSTMPSFLTLIREILELNNIYSLCGCKVIQLLEMLSLPDGFAIVFVIPNFHILYCCTRKNRITLNTHYVNAGSATAPPPPIVLLGACHILGSHLHPKSPIMCRPDLNPISNTGKPVPALHAECWKGVSVPRATSTVASGIGTTTTQPSVSSLMRRLRYYRR